MKTIKLIKENQYKRVADEHADQFIRLKKAVYVPKSEWKTNVRDYNIEKDLIASAQKK